ncbi:hypothetical protein [Marinimicrobium locisalis]|uniref:hypothetical protein n=1 Tax=Marinimicrobium locisalis TaxID=546022 RepID=UPI003222176B
MHTVEIEKFPLRWRWTDEKYCLLPEHELRKIRPLSESAAAKAWETSIRLVDAESDFSPSAELFTDIEFISAEDSNLVRQWLQSKIPDGEIIASWQPEWAVITESELFIKYWDEFCYPSSDDVSIWSKSEKWVVHYHHHEKFCYGKSKNV